MMSRKTHKHKFKGSIPNKICSNTVFFTSVQYMRLKQREVETQFDEKKRKHGTWPF